MGNLVNNSAILSYRDEHLTRVHVTNQLKL